MKKIITKFFFFLFATIIFLSCSNTKDIEGIWEQSDGYEGFMVIGNKVAEITGEVTIKVKKKNEKLTFYFGISPLLSSDNKYKSSFRIIKNENDSLILHRINDGKERYFILNDTSIFVKSDSVSYLNFIDKLGSTNDSIYNKDKEYDWFKFEKPE